MTKMATIERLQLKAINMATVTTSPLQTPVAAVVGSRRFQSRRQWMKRGANNDDWIQVLVQGTKYFNVKDFGAVGDGTTDDRAAINLAKTAAIAVGGGVVFFPPGTYAVYRSGVTSSIQLTGASNTKIVFLGCGRSSRVIATGNAGGGGSDWYLFDIIDGANAIVFKNLCLDGSAQTNLGVGQQHHLVRIAGLTSTPSNIWFIDCYWNKTDGDGVRILGTSGLGAAGVSNVRVIRGCFTMDVNGAGTGSRAGFTLQRNVSHIGLHSTLMNGSTDQVLDMETSGTGENTAIMVERTHMTHSAAAVTTVCSCNGGPNVDFDGLTFSNVIFDGGQIGFLDMSNLTLAFCMQNVTRFASAGTALAIDGVTGSVVYGCQFYRSDTNNVAGAAVQYQNSVAGSSHHILAASVCQNASTPAGGQDGVLVQDTPDVTIDGCIVLTAQLNNNVGVCVRFRSVTTNASRNVCRHSILIGTNAVVGNGVQMASSTSGRTTDGSVAFGNTMRNILNGIALSAVAGAVVSNSFGGNNTAVTTSQMFGTGSPAPNGLCVSANAGVLPLGIWEFTTSPNSQIAAQIGAIGCNRVGAANTTLYVKESAAGLNTGWVAK